jgi:hypothetical protein
MSMVLSNSIQNLGSNSYSIMFLMFGIPCKKWAAGLPSRPWFLLSAAAALVAFEL